MSFPVTRNMAGIFCISVALSACKPKEPVPAVDAGGSSSAPSASASAEPANTTPTASASATSKAVAPAAAPAGPFTAGENWLGTYVCGSAKPTTLALRIKKVSGTSVEAVFDFLTVPAKQKGQFTMNGTVTGNHLHLSFEKWIEHPAGFVPADLDGNVSPDGKVYSGAVIAPSAGCKTFVVRK